MRGEGRRGGVVSLSLAGVCFAVLQGCSTAGPAEQAATTQTVHCSQVRGSVDFLPPLTATGHSAESIKVTVHLARCTTSGSVVPTVTSGTATLTIPVATSACAGLLQFPTSSGGVNAPSSSRALTVRTTWVPARVASSVLRFSGFVAIVDQAGDVGFAFPGVGHQAQMSGSFAGTDNGALSTASVQTDEQAGQILTSCGQASGLSAIALTSGEVTFG